MPAPQSPATPSTSTASASPKRTHPTFHFFSGLVSGVSSAVLLQPADLLKTRVQQSRSDSLLPVLRSILSGPHPVASLWRGTLPSALRTGFGSALYFTTLSSLRQVVASSTTANIANSAINSNGRSSSVLPKLSPTANLLTGASARVFAGLIIMPITVIKVRYESNYYNYNSLFSAIRSIASTEGIKGFFAGFGATAVRDAPYAGLYVVFYETCKSRLSRLLPAQPQTSQTDLSNGGEQRTQKKDTNALINATSGILAAATATAITNPFDAVKTRLQLMPKKYGNTIKAAALMLREDGIRGFFDGLGLRMTRKAVSSALAWTVYEELIGSAERRFIRPDGRTGKEGDEQRL
ncbi:hypothetical protein DV738_g4672, partial [Chaetothyriales sp. CBS 135597]